MAKFVGNNIVVILGSTTITQNDIIDIDYTWTNDKVENQGVADTFETNLHTLTHFTFTINGYDDSPGTATTNSLRAAVMAIQAQTDCQDLFEIRPFGTASTRRKITGTAHLDSPTGSAGAVANALLSATFTATGTVTDTTQA